jgi:anti-anti-sigma regulatory factor
MRTRPTEKVLAAPEELGLESRTAFRRAAGALLEQLPEGAGRLVIDLLATRIVDSAGLGALMLIQRKAAERRLSVSLRDANEELRFLLVLTKLDDLFELESGATP